MPHNQLRLQGGVIVNETPAVNEAGIASSNRIRFRPDPHGLSLPEKLGGWAKFYASQITTGVVRALCGWQDTNDNQWIGVAADGTPGKLYAIQCTVNGSTGLTSATGSLQSLIPEVFTTQSDIVVSATSGSNIYNIVDTNSTTSIGVAPFGCSVYITIPISVAGVILQGLYEVVAGSASGLSYNIVAYDIFGNPLNARYTNYSVFIPITSVSFTAGSPNTLTISYATSYTVPPGEFVNVLVQDHSISGSYVVLSSTSTSFTVATSLGSYTYSTTGDWSNQGTAPIFTTSASSAAVTVTLPNHGLSPGDDFAILNPTVVGGITLQGVFPVQTVTNAYTFTIVPMSTPTAASHQYQGAISSLTGGTSTGSQVTVTYAPLVSYGYRANSGSQVYAQGITPSGWNGSYTITSSSAGSLTYSDATASGSWVSGGSLSSIGGIETYVYTLATIVAPPPQSMNSQFWTLDNWGNILLAASANTPIVSYPTFSIDYQPIWYWDPTEGYSTARPMVGGPIVNNGFFVAMPQRQIVAWGTSFSGIIDPLLLRWCDINNFNTWAAQITNQAGSFRLPSGAAIIGGRQTPQQGLIWTDIELWSMQYINQPLVYSFNKIGQGCGLIGKYAHGVLGGVTYWMSKTQFFVLAGEGVMPMACPIWDVIFQDLDLVNADKITCATNAMFQEVAWYFPVKGGSGENSAYVKYNAQMGLWDYGTLDRSAWLDVSVLQQPIGFSPVDKYIYQHEISPDADGAAMGETFTTGWFALAEGDVMPYVDQFWPDLKWGYFGQGQTAQVQMSFAAQAYPGAAQYSYGPYAVSQSTAYISPRIRNRLVNFTVSGAGTGTWWRLGALRYRVQGDGKY